MLRQTALERDELRQQLDGLHQDRQTLQVELARVRKERDRLKAALERISAGYFNSPDEVEDIATATLIGEEVGR
jgi:septal ring factor EnvC (AmiA/AmiB activator)